MSVTAASTNDNGSAAPEAEQLAFHEPRTTERGEADAERQSDDEQGSVAEDHPDETAAPVPEGHPHADFARPVVDGVRQHAIEADRCQQQGRARQQADQLRGETLAVERGCHLRTQCSRVTDRQTAIDLGDRLAHFIGDGAGVPGCANLEPQSSELTSLPAASGQRRFRLPRLARRETARRSASPDDLVAGCVRVEAEFGH